MKQRSLRYPLTFRLLQNVCVVSLMAADLGSESNPIVIELEASDSSEIVIVKLTRL